MNLSEQIDNQFTDPWRKILDIIAAESDKLKHEAALVGGVVRDMILKRPLNDVDVMFSHPAEPLVREIAKKTKASVVAHERFLTFTLQFDWGEKMDVVTAREEIYVSPAQLPQVAPSTIEKDIKRRDFTINSIACWLNKSRFGEILDPFSGQQDIKEGSVRVLHEKSFIDDPTRIYRAARFAGRFGFRLDNETERLLMTAVRSKGPAELSPVRLRHEFEMILKEERPWDALALLENWGALIFVHPQWRLQKDHQQGKMPGKSNLNERLIWWFKPWGREKSEAMMKALEFERDTKKSVLSRI